MIGMIGYWASFTVGGMLLCTSLIAGVQFLKDYLNTKTEASRDFALGILLLAISLGSNTLYWQVFGQLGLWLEVLDLSTLRTLGSYLDVLFKGSGVVGFFYTLRGLKKLQ